MARITPWRRWVTVTVTAKKPVTVPELGKDEVIVKEDKKTTLTIKFPKD